MQYTHAGHTIGAPPLEVAGFPVDEDDSLNLDWLLSLPLFSVPLLPLVRSTGENNLRGLSPVDMGIACGGDCSTGEEEEFDVVGDMGSNAEKELGLDDEHSDVGNSLFLVVRLLLKLAALCMIELLIFLSLLIGSVILLLPKSAFRMLSMLNFSDSSWVMG